jgi:hypothetical protein
VHSGGSLVAVVAAEVKAAGWGPLSAQSAGYDVLSLVEVFGCDAVAWLKYSAMMPLLLQDAMSVLFL